MWETAARIMANSLKIRLNVLRSTAPLSSLARALPIRQEHSKAGHSSVAYFCHKMIHNKTMTLGPQTRRALRITWL
jgi:hypothetical protein